MEYNKDYYSFGIYVTNFKEYIRTFCFVSLYQPRFQANFISSTINCFMFASN